MYGRRLIKLWFDQLWSICEQDWFVKACASQYTDICTKKAWPVNYLHVNIIGSARLQPLQDSMLFCIAFALIVIEIIWMRLFIFHFCIVIRSKVWSHLTIILKMFGWAKSSHYKRNSHNQEPFGYVSKCFLTQISQWVQVGFCRKLRDL